MYKQDLAFNNWQGLICYKTQTIILAIYFVGTTSDKSFSVMTLATLYIRDSSQITIFIQSSTLYAFSSIHPTAVLLS